MSQWHFAEKITDYYANLTIIIDFSILFSATYKFRQDAGNIRYIICFRGLTVKLHVNVVLISLFLMSLMLITPAVAAGPGDPERVIIMFFQPATTEDMDYLRAMGGLIRYTCSAINGVAVELPAAALDKLMIMYQNPSAPQSDSIAKNISFIVNDGMPFPFVDNAASAGSPDVAPQSPREIVPSAIAGSVEPVACLPLQSIFTFPVLPLAVRP
jgi:hypothetical protein